MPKTVAEIRAEIEAAKIFAMNRFERDWGTRDVQKVVGALRQTIPGSASPADAARKARAITRIRPAGMNELDLPWRSSK